MTHRRRLTTTLTVGAVGLIAVAAVVVSVVQGDKPPLPEGGKPARDEALVGPHSPAPGALEGRLLISRGDRCSIQEIDLQRARVERAGSVRGCQLWVSPTGELAVSGSLTPGAGEPAGRSLLTVNGAPALVASQPPGLKAPGPWRANPAWSPSGAELAVCGDNGKTSLINVEGGQTSTIEGCWPTFTPRGTVLSLRDPVLDTRTAPEPSVPIPSLEGGRPLLSTVRQAILEDGRVRLELSAVRAALPGSARSLGRILGYAADGKGRLAVSVLYLDGLEVRSALQIWDGASLSESLETPVLLGDRTELERSTQTVQTLRFSPDADEIAVTIGTAASRKLLVLDARSGTRVLGPTTLLAFDWSPSGDWLGVATADEIEIYGPDRSRTPTFTLPVSVSALAWRPR